MIFVWPVKWFRKKKLKFCDCFQCACRYFLQDTAYAILFRDGAYTIYWNLINIVRTVSEKTAILCFGTHLKGPLFWDLECSVAPGTELGWINSWVSNTRKIHPTVQAPVRGSTIRTYRDTYRQTAFETPTF